MKPTIAVSGSLAQRPFHGGHTWVFLQYLLGFRRLGWDVLFIDRLEPEMCTDDRGVPTGASESVNLRYLATTMEQFGLRDAWVLLAEAGRRAFGLERREALRRLSGSVFVLDVMGFLDDAEMIEAAPRRIFLDIDPGFGQMWHALGLADPFAGHDAHVTIGEGIGGPDCRIPTCGLDWITTKQPVVLDQWQVAAAPASAYTSIGAWRGPFEPIDYDGEVYGLRVHEFRRFLELPRRVEAQFEVALDIDDADEGDRLALEGHGWRLTDPCVVAGDPRSYREHIRGSRGELMIAKNLYVRARSGWFSDRSTCYLASGRPVIAQDTGLAPHLPQGDGLVAFSTLDEAVAAVEDVERRYEHHAEAARAVAEQHFSSDVVLARLLEQLDVAPVP